MGRMKTFLVTVTHQDGTPYQDNLQKAIGDNCTVAARGYAAYGEADRDRWIAAAEAAGLKATATED